MKVLVTGSNGQLGSEIRDLVSDYPEFEFVFLDRQDLSLEDLSNLEKLFDQHQPSFFINCAAYTAVDKAEEEQEMAMLVNAKAVGQVASQCKKHNCRLVHISTDYVFNGNSDHPFLVANQMHRIIFEKNRIPAPSNPKYFVLLKNQY